ncbi:hypothetical protein A2716_00255 [candidate division WWE3 bacterium RIFCSPHIGHO2_01_FULL_40_23]|uniref:Fibronectin type-III domain-containing protein n=1 Tax=candidate division WWE3 bacterium RIFCSPLOWO2_01_FULL_41_18 TaxID=1802625 RepID=A0A1F4VEN1_UNCKA|nr:MAG: hypothetical protein A2716_00255 [candidate division WWE3 bacterium RIFCSPHIGHO2_01_FULL_40_23]OGC55428.1 MAG: hypothetical protein A3A78_00525 [candidate division WWE3 bacterium RIFCSPLOWO2_01_FULL_41_18]
MLEKTQKIKQLGFSLPLLLILVLTLAGGTLAFLKLNSIPKSGEILSEAKGPDKTPPVRSNGLPTGALSSGTTQVDAKLTTNEKATCRYDTSPNILYKNQKWIFSTTGDTSHSTLITGLSNGTSYSLYVRCRDRKANVNTDDFLITFSVENGSTISDTTPPSVSLTNPLNGSTVSDTSVLITATASDNASVSKVEFYVDSVLKGTDYSSSYSYTWDTTPYLNGSHILLAKAFDTSSNSASSSVSVTVNNQTPTPTLTPTPTPTPTPTVTPTPTPTPPPTTGDYLLMPRSQLLSLSTTSTAWNNVKGIADGDLGTPDLKNQDNKHDVKTLAVALVYARIGNTPTMDYRTKARNAIMSVMGTEQVGAYNSILSLGRQLGAYVLAADFINLDGADDETFRAWLKDIRTKELGGHGRWIVLTQTHGDSNNNWGSFAGASRIAASMYLNDTTDVEAASKVFRGFTGDRNAYASFRTISSTEATWACSQSTTLYTPINPPCYLSGINVDGAIVGDIYRDSTPLQWPPTSTGISYTLESLQGLVLQAELLSRAGYDSWNYSDKALKRAADLVSRDGRWNYSSVSYHVPWILNKRYGLNIPTRSPASYGRVFGYTDWLYGN